MNFPEAIEAGLKNYANFAGRASRSEYWFWVLFAVLVGLVAGAIDGAVFGKSSLLSALVSIAGLLPGISVGVRRLHDIDRAGWWLLLNFVLLIGPLVLLVFSCLEGTRGFNRFGPDPLAMDALPL